MIQVYIAAPYPVRDLAIRMMRRLELQRMYVTSRWLKQEDEINEAHALMDLADVACADVIVVLNPEGWCNFGTGGRHVELGYAIALKKPILLVGERSNIFHHLSCVKVVDDTEDITKHVQKLAASRIDHASV